MNSDLFKQIEDLVPALDGWCVPEKACDFAAIILALRPEFTIEVGVWGGRGALSMALAHRFVGCGRVIAVDPWEASASVVGQGGADADWWSDQSKHDLVYSRFIANVHALDLAKYVDIRKERSDVFQLPPSAGLVVIDGNHSEQAIADVERIAPIVMVGGMVYLDDLNWSGGAVRLASRKLQQLGFVGRFQRDQGAFFQRVYAA